MPKAPVRVTAVLPPDELERVKYWAASHGISVNEYVRTAVEEAIRRENRDYDLPTLETARLAQLVDAIGAMSANLRNLEHIVVDGFDQFVRLTRGENYLDLHDSVYDDEDDAEEGKAWLSIFSISRVSRRRKKVPRCVPSRRRRRIFRRFPLPGRKFLRSRPGSL